MAGKDNSNTNADLNPDLELMRHFDGEGGVAPVDGDEDAAAKLTALGEIGDALRVAIGAEAREAATPAAFEAMWDRIDARIATPVEAPTEQRERVSTSETETGGFFSGIGAWLDRYRSQVFTGLASAAAAGALVWFIRPPTTVVEHVEVQPATQTDINRPIMVSAQATEVESLEVYDGSGIVLTIPAEGDDGSPTSVIWLLPPKIQRKDPSKMSRLAVTIAFMFSITFAGVIASPGSVHAEGEEASCSVLEISASPEAGGIDKQLKVLEKRFKREPFSSTWKTFKLVKKHDRKLLRMKAGSIKLTSGQKLSLLYRDYYAPTTTKSRKQTKPRLRISISLDKKDGKRIADQTLKVDVGDYSLTTFPGTAGKAVILATTCTVK